jgi:thymidylate kinase
MLQIYKKLFKSLNENHIKYVVYKGIEHLKEDLNGNRGDIDILVDSNSLKKIHHLLLSNGFKKVIKNNFPSYYFGLNRENHQFIMLDIESEIKFGYKPYRPYRYNLDFKKLKIKKEDNVYILEMQDYIPLMFLSKLTSISPKQEDLEILKTFMETEYNIQDGYMGKILKEKTDLEWSILNKKIVTSKNWSNLQKEYKDIFLKNIITNHTLLWKQKFKTIGLKMETINRKILKKPPYKIRKRGYLVAFIGIDGAGKSSTVDYLLSLDYFKHTGIKRIYFGNNEYWIPGLLWAVKNIRNRYILIALHPFTYWDKAFRSIIAHYYIFRGNIVIADRFYYDDMIAAELNKEKVKPRSLLKRVYFKIFAPRIWTKPDMTIFLNVTSSVAYERKQDFSFETMIKVNNAYKAYMPSVENVVIIDADQKQTIIFDSVVENIMKRDRA